MKLDTNKGETVINKKSPKQEELKQGGSPPPTPTPFTVAMLLDMIENYYQIGFGVYNGTRFYGGPQSKVCEQAVSTYITTFSTSLPDALNPPPRTSGCPEPPTGTPPPPPPVTCDGIVNKFQVARLSLQLFTNVATI